MDRPLAPLYRTRTICHVGPLSGYGHGRGVLARPATSVYRFGQRREQGFATLEAIFGIFFLILIVAGVLVTSAWPSRLNAAKAAAYEAARAVAEAPDQATGEDTGRRHAEETWANHGYGAESISVEFTTAGRGESLTATVHIVLPVLQFPLVGSWDAAPWSVSSTVRVADYRGYR